MQRPLAIASTIGAIAVAGLVGIVALRPEATPRSTEINVHVAASLTGVFTELGESFMALHGEVNVRFNFGGSTTLVQQIEQGAPADMVALADSNSIDRLVASGLVERTDVVDLAYNRLAILVERDNPLQIASLNDLERKEVTVVLCDEAQPCGRYADELLERSGLTVPVAGREANATAVVARIANGEADAGIAYVTDGRSSKSAVDVVEIPEERNIRVNYPMVRISEPSSKNDAVISEFFEFVSGPTGDRVLAEAGFVLP